MSQKTDEKQQPRTERLNLPDIPKWRPGAIFWKPLDDGNEVTVYPTVTGGGQICKGPLADQFGYDEAWLYGHAVEAIEAAKEWDGESDPPGKWLRATGIGEHDKHVVRRHGEPKKNESFKIEEGDEVDAHWIWGNPMPEFYIVTRQLPNGNTLLVEGLHDAHAPNGVIRVVDVKVSPPTKPGDALIYDAGRGEHVAIDHKVKPRTKDGM